MQCFGRQLLNSSVHLLVNYSVSVSSLSVSQDHLFVCLSVSIIHLSVCVSVSIIYVCESVTSICLSLSVCE